MIETGEQVYYLSEFFKSRWASRAVVEKETQARRAFLDTFIPLLRVSFQRRGVNALIDVIGSVAAGRALVDSDIDLLVREAGTDDLERVREVGIDVRIEDIDERQLPYKVQFWFDHPYGWERTSRSNNSR